MSVLGAVLGGLISAGGTIGAGMYAGQSAKQINDANLAQARRLNSEAVHLANTAHQREIVDLALAGLNPVLSASGSGASVPSLQQADLDNPGAHVANGVSSAARLFNADVLSRIDLNSAQTARTSAEARNLDASTDAIKAQKEADIAEAALRLDQIDFDRARLADEQEAYANVSMKNVGSVEHPHFVNNPEFQKLLREGIISDAKLRSNSNWRANLSSFTPFVSPAAINSGVNSARTIQRIHRTSKIPVF